MLAGFGASYLVVCSPRLGRDSWLLWFSLAYGILALCCGLFALILDAIGGLYSVNVALPGHLYYFSNTWPYDPKSGALTMRHPDTS